jgi:hypothetical protein
MNTPMSNCNASLRDILLVSTASSGAPTATPSA